MKIKVSDELIEYVMQHILPQYDHFDAGHNQAHIRNVIERSFKICMSLANKLSLNLDMIYIIAAYHDLGMKISRKDHPMHSATLLLTDKMLAKHFSPKQLEVMAQAVRDHSTSSTNAPKSIYGEIVSDADKDLSPQQYILRAWNYTQKYNPHFTKEQHIDNTFKEIVRRFGKADIGGSDLVRFYIKDKQNEKFLSYMQQLAYNRQMFDDQLEKAINS